MKVEDRIGILEQQHKQLDNEIKTAYNRYIDDVEIEQLKKRKLYIKDELNKLQGILS